VQTPLDRPRSTKSTTQTTGARETSDTRCVSNMNRQRDSSSLSLAHKSAFPADHRRGALRRLDSPAKANSRNPDPVTPEQASPRPGCGYSEKTRNPAISSAADKKTANNPGNFTPAPHPVPLPAHFCLDSAGPPNRLNRPLSLCSSNARWRFASCHHTAMNSRKRSPSPTRDHPCSGSESPRSACR
jgi:hypothetical protein